MIRIPEPQNNKALRQTNKGNIFGELWSTWNIDLMDNPGAIRLGRKMKLLSKTGDSNLTSFALPCVFKVFDGLIWTIAGTRVYKNQLSGGAGTLLTAFVDDTSTGFATNWDDDFSDLENFNGVLIATSQSDIYSKAASGSGTGAWTDRGNLTNNSGSKKLCFFKRYNRVYFFDNAEVKSMDTGYSIATSGDYYLSLSGNGILTCLEASSDKIWIGLTLGQFQSQGYTEGARVYEWDGISNQITRDYKIPAAGVLAMEIIDDIPVIMDSNGILRQLSATGFVEIGRLPLRRNQYLGQITTAANTRFIHPNGLIKGPEGTILALVCNRNYYLSGSTENVNENLPSGIWEWSKEHGFVHKHSLTQLALSSSSPTDFGMNRILQAGALAYAKIDVTSGQGSLIAGASYYTSATATVDGGIFVEAPFPSDNSANPEGQKYGYFVSSWIQSVALKDAWQKLGLKFRKFLDANDGLRLKYRTTEADPIEITGTWTTVNPTQTTFTTTTNVSTKVGYEIEVLQGVGSGKTAHIVSVSENGGTYTVVVDEKFTDATGTAKIRIQNWTKVKLNTSDLLGESVLKSLVTIVAERIQVKVCMQYTGDGEVQELDIINSPHTLFE